MKKLITCLLSVFGFLSFNAQCDYSISMQDTYGDGWNGASIGVEINGVDQDPLSISGAQGTSTFGTFTGDEVVFTWNSGSYDGEINFQISDPSGTEIYNGGAPADDGEAFLTSTSNATCTPPSCPTPVLMALTVESESAVATWNNDDAFTSFTLEIGDTGFVQGTGNEYTANDTTYTFTGLSENTFYSFYITSYCGGDQSLVAAGPYSFQTFCNTITNGWSTEFASGHCPWNVYDVNGDNYRWALYNPLEGANAEEYVLNSYSPGAANDYLMSPAFTCSDGTTDRVRFDSKNPYHTYSTPYYDTLTIGVYDAGVTTLLGELGTIIPETVYATYEYDLSDYEGQDIRVFIYSGGGNNGISFIDNVVVDAFPSCTAPSNLSAANSTGSTSDLSWDANGTETAWNVEYGAPEFDLGEGTLESASSPTYTVTGLAGAAVYEYYVQAVCGGEVSDWVGPFTFSTLGDCGAYTVTLVDTYGDGWNGGLLEVSINSVVAYSLTIGSGGGPESTEIQTNIGDILEFNYTAGGYPSENEYTVTNELGEVVAEEGQNDGTPGSVSFTACATCPDLDASTFTLSNITSSEADISWAVGDAETAWNLEYGLSGFVLGNGTVEASSNPSFQLTGLVGKSTYDVYVQADCGSGETGSWVGPLTFSTAGTCGFANFNYLNEGTYPGENSYNILDVNGAVLVAVPATGTGPANTQIGINTCDRFTLELIDSYGDSWNGNNFEIITSSNTFGPYTVADGFSASFELNLCPSETEYNISETACDSYTWADGDGNIYTESGTYTISEIASDGCDSIVNLTLIINESTSSLISDSECDSYNWNGNNYNESGIYTHETTNIQNCPNIDSLDLTIDVSTSSFEQASSCESYVWNGITYSQSGEYTLANLENSAGCDSTATLDLTINVSNSSFQQASSCESYEWNGTTYSDIGNNSYTYNTVTVNGCDSIAELLLTINASTSSFEQASSCVSYNWNGINYTESGLYTFESTNSAGCSNLDSLNLTITTVGSTSDIIACDSYDWNGLTYNSSGNYENDNGGCIDYLNLTINVSSSSFEQASSCGSYDWNGTTYSQSGNYTGPTTTNQVGCDSTSTLELTINEAVENNITETVCDELEWNEVTYTESGNYSYQGTTTNGCDSTVNLTLTVNVSTSTFDQASSCDTFVWNGDTLSTSGIYVVESTNNAGCPNVDSLNLTINNSATEAISESACNSYEWDGSTYTVSGEYPYYSETVSGCDSTVILSLTVNYTTDSSLAVTECISYNFNGEILTLSGDYSDTIQSSTDCDSIINLSLTILGPDSVNVTVIECDADSYEWDSETYTASGSYSNSYQNVNGCDSIVTLDLTFNDPYAGAFLADFDDSRATFAAPTTLPGCWTLENTNLSTWTNSIGGLTVLGFNGFISGPSSGSNGEGDYLYVQTYNFDAGAYAPHNDSSIINTKEVDLSSLTTPELFFHYQLHGEHMGHLSVWINDASGSTEIFNKNGEMGNTWYEESIDLSDYSGTVSFSLLSILDTTGTGLTAASEMAVDNFEVREQPSCYDPYNLIVESIDGSTATVSWLTNPSITSWNYVFGDPGVNPDSATVMTTTSSTLEIEDLAFASQYEIYVQSDCGTDWEGPLTINVPFPEDYGCTHTLNMIDDYGDGWNGGSIDVLINGATAISGGTVATGTEASIEFGAEDGDDITITNFVPGSWASEISFNVTDGSGTVIYSSGEAGDLDASSVIDTTVIGGCPENDLVAIAAAVPSGCDLTEAESLEIWVYNAGVGAETGFTVSYSVNGGAEVTEDVTETLNAGDTLMYMFTTAADMSIAGEYDVTMSCSLSTDVLNTNDTVFAMGMNIASPEAPTTMGDTICSGEEGNLMAMSNSYIVWQDANGNVVGFGENLMVMDTVTASYYSEARAEMDIINDDFEDYTAGDLIAASSDEWGAWSGPNGGGADDAAVSSDQAADGSNSLYLNNADGDDIVLPLGDEAYDSGIVTLEMDMFIVTTGYFNLQTQPTAGIGWAFSVFFDGGSVNVSEGATNTELSGTYPGANEWFNVALALDIDNGIGQLYIDGESQGTFEFNSTLGGVNIYANAGDEYYIDNVAASYVTSCGSELSEAIITINDCVGINELTNNNVSIYPNPSNGEFMVTNNVDINTISITDAQGKVVHSMNNLNLNKVNVDITNLEKGMYLINIETVNGTITKPVMVK